MTAECDIRLPSLTDVLKRYPFEVSEEDNYLSLTKKIRELLIYGNGTNSKRENG